MQEKNKETEDGLVAIRTPRLDPLERLYVRTYLHTFSHTEAHKAVSPGIKHPKVDNGYSQRENVKFHISLALQQKAEALSLSPELVLERLYLEATREGSGSNHAARIQALTLLGRHLGMFQEKKETDTYTFNIVNYSDTPLALKDVEKVVELEQIETEVVENTITPTIMNIEIKEYK